ncbi:hypothetical protein ACO0LD_28535 [Undibacterium sp. Ji83W]|uniref:hypothetical protein n=1 Tax=Undibacterium sp. Ji83W TaxID=3413043 RepID=UPI003BF11075
MKINYRLWKTKRTGLVNITLILVLAIALTNMTEDADDVQKDFFVHLNAQIPVTVQKIYCYRIDAEPDAITSQLNCVYSADSESKNKFGSEVVDVPSWLGRDIDELDLIKGKVGMEDGLYIFAGQGNSYRKRWSHIEIFFLQLLIDRIALASKTVEKNHAG